MTYFVMPQCPRLPLSLSNLFQAAVEKKKRREELEREIEKVKEARAWEEKQEVARREEELR